MIFPASCTRVDRVRVKEVDFKNISLYQIRFSCVSETKSSKSYDLNSKEYETTHLEQITSFRRYLPQVFKSSGGHKKKKKNHDKRTEPRHSIEKIPAP